MSVTGLTVGIVGLPNSGKSTLFNALLKRQIAQVGEYPYTTIEPNVGVVEVPDKRLEKIANILKISKKVPAAIKFIDIAGLIKGAHKGEGLGNQFLGHIREVDAICHVVRAFENPNVEHIGGRIDPEVDVEVVNDELFKAEIDKPTLYIINFSQNYLNKNYDTVFPYIKICAKLEVELSELSGEEQKSYLAELGVDPSTGLSLSQIIKESYKLLDLITFFTIVGGKMVQAWPVKRTTKMVEVAEIVHTDFAKGFIAAEIIDWQKLVDSGSWTSAKENGLIKTVGRDEEIVDGLVVEFKSSI